MKEYAKKPEPPSRTIQSNTKASKQAPISEILQAYKDGTLGRRPIQRESIEDEDLLQAKAAQQDHIKAVLQQYKEKNMQRYAPEEDEELIQGKFDTAQREEIDEDELLQGKFESNTQTEQEPVQREEKPNNTGLPDNLKTGIENLSGYSMDDVKVHYNSDKPAQLNALAYAQGTDIHVATGEEKHLPHEAWHVVQQKQGRVQPTMQMQGVNVNDNEGLEKEADVMGGETSIQRIENMSYSVVQLQKRILGGNNEHQTHVIGVNLMPSGGLSEVLPYSGRGYSSLSNKIAGHTSIISGRLNLADQPMTLDFGRGFSPHGFINSIKVGLGGLFKLNAEVEGSYHAEEQSIVEDIRSEQLLIRVTMHTKEVWERMMGQEEDGRRYTYAPTAARNGDFEDDRNGGDNITDNCTTIALRKAMNICKVLIDEPNIYNMDKLNLGCLWSALSHMIKIIVDANVRAQTTVGTQGRAMRAIQEINSFHEFHELQELQADGFGLFLPPYKR